MLSTVPTREAAAITRALKRKAGSTIDQASRSLDTARTPRWRPEGPGGEPDASIRTRPVWDP